jgi:hypothetical protein
MIGRSKRGQEVRRRVERDQLKKCIGIAEKGFQKKESISSFIVEDVICSSFRSHDPFDPQDT